MTSSTSTRSSDQNSGGNSDEQGRTTAEWVTFGVSCLVLLAVAALVLSRLLGANDPAAPTATAGAVTTVLQQRQVPVTVGNAGDETAANVTVRLEFEVDGEKDDAEQTVDFLAGGEQVDLVFVLPDDADAEGVTARVTGFSDP